VNWFLKFDEEKLRPFFIRKYNPAKAVLEDEYQELIKLKFRDQLEQEEEMDLVERVDTMRRTASAVQRVGGSFYAGRSVLGNDEFNITHFIQNNADRQRSLSTAKSPSNEKNKPMFTGLL